MGQATTPSPEETLTSLFDMPAVYRSMGRLAAGHLRRARTGVGTNHHQDARVCSRDDCPALQQDAHRERLDEHRHREDLPDGLRDHPDGHLGHPPARADHRVVAGSDDR